MKNVKQEGSNAIELTALQKAFLTIRKLREQLDAARATRAEPIAVVGLGCRLPGADGPEAFWRLLSEGRDAITEVPRERWNVDALYDPRPGTPGKVYSRCGGFLDNVELFDAAFFGISAREAATVDPQQRLLLEVAWEALEHAGIAPSSLKATPTGVFVGVTASDYAYLQLEQNKLPDDPYFNTGAALNACAGRISYVLGLQGPSVAIDTACSSSLTAVHLACSSLRNRECETALAGGVNLILATWPNVTLAAAQMVAPDGRCKTFDASADGYVRGEGCGMVVLRRLSDALKAGDHILALIRGTAINQDGASSGFSVPNGIAQQALIRRTLEAAGVEPAEIDYVESHGTGTALGDPIEAGALGAVLGRDAAREQPLWVGSVKSNIGHLESAAGVTGLIKLVLAMCHGRIPPTLHINQPNPKIDWDGMNLRPARESVDWPRGTRRRLAALSSFGVSGSNAHLILEEAPPVSVARPERDRQAHVLTLSAKTRTALAELAATYDEFLAGRPDDAVADICYTANCGRSHFKHRAAIRASHIEDLRVGLAGIRDGRQTPGLFLAGETPSGLGSPVFVFSDAEVMNPGTGRELYETGAAFRAAVDACDAARHPDLDATISAVLFAEADERLRQPIYQFSAQFALQYALAALWQSFGIRPLAVSGRGLGELCAACVAGVFDLEDGLRLACERARLSSRDDIATYARGLRFRAPQIATWPDGRPIAEGTVFDAAYWRRQFQAAVPDPRETIDALTENRDGPFIEIGTGQELSKLAGQIKPHSPWLPSMSGGGDEWRSLLTSLAEAYINGIDVNWAKLDESTPRRRLHLPTYRFQRKRYWIEERDEIMTPASTEPTVSEDDRLRGHRASVKSDIVRLVAEILREQPEHVPLDVPFLEMGADSLILVYAVKRIDELFRVKLEIRQFFEEITTVASLAEYIADRVPPPARVQSSVQSLPASSQAPAAPVTSAPAAPSVCSVSLPEVAVPVALSESIGDAFGSDLPRIIQAQMQLMSRQLDLLQRASVTSQPAVTPRPSSAAGEITSPGATPVAPRANGSGAAVGSSVSTARTSPLNDIKNPVTAKTTGMTEQQQSSLDDFIRRFTSRTRRSKALAQSCRDGLADSRATVGFRFSTKEILYPITGAEALGSSLKDVDGNTYVDLTMGFGALLFGSRPDFVRQAIADELQRGIQLGMRSDLMEEVTRLFLELTGKQRVVFTNSGTEAVMTALRLARAATGRTKIALFEGAYHGHSDGTLAQRGHDQFSSEPVAPGIPANVTRDVLVLEYGTPQSLDVLREHAHELAAVLVEPVQSRRPDFQPVNFLRELRALTEASGTALIFDEMITGFRVHPAGCQGLFGIDADIATYGKIIGGGMPIGAVAGSARFLDGIDGGTWRFGDNSYPGAARTYFGGTFCQHPVTMAASLAALRHLKAQGPALQTTLNRRTEKFAETLNTFFAGEGLPIRVAHFSSFFRFEFSGNLELFFYHLLSKGIYIWEWRNCFLSTAHTDEDLERVIRAVKESVADLRAAGFLPSREPSARPTTPVPPAGEAPVRSDKEAGGANDHPADNGGGNGFWNRGKSKLGQRGEALAVPTAAARRGTNQPLAFSLSYFGTYQAAYSPSKYELLIEGARFADAEGFQAVWIPERHFHEFGGLSPNPSVLAAALARETKRVQLRAGSVVMPLHHPMRVAEEWSLVDNLAGGRVGVAFASGWHPNDFVFAPQSFGRQRELTFEGMEAVRRAWRGEPLSLRDGTGKEVELKLHPLPSQTELPCWLTIVNNRETYRTAGQLGVGVLTNLMGQTLEELTANVAIYRAALDEFGHDPRTGRVAVLLHTYVREDAEQAIREARRPLCDYLLSSMTLFKRLVQSQSLPIDLDGLSVADREYIVQKAYDKYVAFSALIGSPDTCRPIVESLVAAGVDEIACFVDFGVSTESALRGLPSLNELRKRWAAPSAPPDTSSFAMSEAQQQLWLLSKVSDDGARAYNDPAVLTIDGEIDPDAFNGSLNQVIARHESLRTTVDPSGERLVVHPPAPVTVQYLDMSAAEDPEAEVRRHLDQLNRTLIDLVNGPVFTATLLKVAARRHVLVLGSHHLLTDGMSMMNVIGELNACYVARRRGTVPALEPPPQYRDFVRWHDEQRSTPAMGEHENYWLRQFEKPPAPADLPTDYPRPAVKTFNGAVRQLALDKSLTGRATKLANSNGYTPFMLLLAVYAVLLHRLTGRETLVVGCPCAGRPLEGGDSLVGYCAHLLPVVSTISRAPAGTPFSEHLRRVRGTLLDAYQHQDYPFARLLNKLNLKRDVSRSPLISTIFNLERPSAESTEGGLKIARHERQVNFARMDLTLTANLVEEGAVLECDYNTDLFDAATIDRILVHYKTLLESVVENPDADVHRLPLLDEQMLHERLRTWNDTEPQSVGRCVHQLFESQAERQPDATAVHDKSPAGVRLSYRELNERANQLAHFLRRSGIGPEQRVGVYVRRSVDLLVALLGTLKTGAAYVPMDAAYPAARLEQIQDDARLAMLLTQQELLAELPNIPGAAFCLDEEGDPLAGESKVNPALPVDPDNPAYVMYTSGSTGRPKGVVIPHRGLTNYLLWAARAYMPDGGAAPVVGSIGFDATITSLFVPLVAGGAVDLLPEGEELTALADALRRDSDYRFVKITPAHLDVLNRLLASGPDARGTRRLVLGGEAISPRALDNWTRDGRLHIINEYGPTEAVVGCCTYDFSGPPGHSVPIGRPISGARLYVLDDHSQLAPVGVPGELYIGGAGLARGYLGRPDLTAASFVPDPFAGRGGLGQPGDRLYKTGDRARYLADGSLEYLGRTDGQIKLRGFRIELAEIESVVLGRPEVVEAAVMLREDEPGNPRIVAYVRPAEGEAMSVGRLRDELKRLLPDYMVPSAFVRLDTMPLTTNGKVDRAALPAPDRQRPEQSAEFAAPRNDLERALAEIHRNVLNLERVGVHDNFFDLGGNSLLAVEAFRRMESLADGKCQPLDLFRYPTIRSLAEFLGHVEESPQNGDDEIRRRVIQQKESRRKLADKRKRITS
jgi:iturin family lipopeptide synthetase A